MSYNAAGYDCAWNPWGVVPSEYLFIGAGGRQSLRENAQLSSMFRPSFASPAQELGAPRSTSGRWHDLAAEWARRLWLALLAMIAIVGLALVVILVALRVSYSERIFPAITVADVPVGGSSLTDARSALAVRADAIESSTVTMTRGDAVWTASLRDIGVSIDEEAAIARAEAVGRETSAYERLRSTARLLNHGARISMPIALDYRKLDGWFDEIDRGLGTPPRNAAVEIQGANVVVVPEVDGIVVDREAARAEIAAGLQTLNSMQIELPVSARTASVRAVDLEPARTMLVAAMSHPVQVSSGSGVWTLPASDIAAFLKQDFEPGEGGAPAITLGLDRTKLAGWLEELLAAQVETEPVDAVLGWNGEKVVSVEESVDGVRLDAAKLAEAVEGRFFGDGGTVTAPLTYVKPEIDSGNLDALGITSFLGSGQSNYSGSSDGRSTNVAAGARLLNGTLVPPGGEFSFNNAIGLIDEEKGFVEAQVIDGEKIGKDIGGGICQVSTTVFRAAFLAGLPITEWWPHRFRIGFYEYEGWEPGLDASILQPTDDPATWADFRFENPSDAWMLIESWTDGTNVVVNIYGADLGYQVEVTGPTWGDKSQMLPPQEVVDDELDPGTVTLVQAAGIGEELSQYRVVRDRNGELLWERSFYTKYFPRGDMWKVSEDMKGNAPIDPTFKFPPLPPAGVDSHGWEPGMQTLSVAAPVTQEWVSGQEQPVAETQPEPLVEELVAPAEEWVAPAEAWEAPAEEWTPPAEEWVPPLEGDPSG